MLEVEMHSSKAVLARINEAVDQLSTSLEASYDPDQACKEAALAPPAPARKGDNHNEVLSDLGSLTKDVPGAPRQRRQARWAHTVSLPVDEDDDFGWIAPHFLPRRHFRPPSTSPFAGAAAVLLFTCLFFCSWAVTQSTQALANGSCIVSPEPNDLGSQRPGPVVAITLSQSVGDVRDASRDGAEPDMAEGYEWTISVGVVHDWTISVGALDIVDPPAAPQALDSTHGAANVSAMGPPLSLEAQDC
jgi:hypothetical protein